MNRQSFYHDGVQIDLDDSRDTFMSYASTLPAGPNIIHHNAYQSKFEINAYGNGEVVLRPAMQHEPNNNQMGGGLPQFENTPSGVPDSIYGAPSEIYGSSDLQDHSQRTSVMGVDMGGNVNDNNDQNNNNNDIMNNNNNNNNNNDPQDPNSPTTTKNITFAPVVVAQQDVPTFHGDMNFEELDKDTKVLETDLGTIFRYMDSYDRFIMFLAVIGSIVSGSLSPAVSVVIGMFTNSITSPADMMSGVVTVVYILVAFGAAAAISAYLHVFGWMTVSERNTAKLRAQYCKSLLSQGQDFWSQTSQGEVLVKMTSNVAIIKDGTGQKLGAIIQALCGLLTGIVIAFIHGWSLTLIIFACAMPLVIVALTLGGVSSGIATKEQECMSTAGGVVSQSFSFINVVKAMQLEQWRWTKFAEVQAKWLEYAIQKCILLGVTVGLFMCIIYNLYGAGFYVSAVFIRDQVMAWPGTIYDGRRVLTIFYALLLSISSVGQIGPSLRALGDAKTAAFPLFETIDREITYDPFVSHDELLQLKQDLVDKMMHPDGKGGGDDENGKKKKPTSPKAGDKKKEQKDDATKTQKNSNDNNNDKQSSMQAYSATDTTTTITPKTTTNSETTEPSTPSASTQQQPQQTLSSPITSSLTLPQTANNNTQHPAYQTTHRSSDVGLFMNPAKFAGHIDLVNVCFHYPTNEHRWILDDLNMTLNTGHNALIGSSGCGKSTIFCLLLKEYEAQFGDIYLEFFMTEEDEKIYQAHMALKKKREYAGIEHLVQQQQDNLVQNNAGAGDVAVIDVVQEEQLQIENKNNTDNNNNNNALTPITESTPSMTSKKDQPTPSLSPLPTPQQPMNQALLLMDAIMAESDAAALKYNQPLTHPDGRKSRWVNLRDINTASLRDMITICQQTPTVFAGTIRDNILLGNPDATEEEVEEATKIANLYSFIQTLPYKYDTPITKLSGGQLQKLQLSRIIVSDKPIVCLDEISASLDLISSKAIHNNLEQWVQIPTKKFGLKKMILEVSHKLATIHHSDCIYVFGIGHIQSSGTHDELYRDVNGFYRRVLDEQLNFTKVLKTDGDASSSRPNSQVPSKQHDKPRGVKDALFNETDSTDTGAILIPNSATNTSDNSTQQQSSSQQQSSLLKSQPITRRGSVDSTLSAEFIEPEEYHAATSIRNGPGGGVGNQQCDDLVSLLSGYSQVLGPDALRQYQQRLSKEGQSVRLNREQLRQLASQFPQLQYAPSSDSQASNILLKYPTVGHPQKSHFTNNNNNNNNNNKSLAGNPTFQIAQCPTFDTQSVMSGMSSGTAGGYSQQLLDEKPTSIFTNNANATNNTNNNNEDLPLHRLELATTTNPGSNTLRFKQQRPAVYPSGRSPNPAVNGVSPTNSLFLEPPTLEPTFSAGLTFRTFRQTAMKEQYNSMRMQHLQQQNYQNIPIAVAPGHTPNPQNHGSSPLPPNFMDSLRQRNHHQNNNTNTNNNSLNNNNSVNPANNKNRKMSILNEAFFEQPTPQNSEKNEDAKPFLPQDAPIIIPQESVNTQQQPQPQQRFDARGSFNQPISPTLQQHLLQQQLSKQNTNTLQPPPLQPQYASHLGLAKAPSVMLTRNLSNKPPIQGMTTTSTISNLFGNTALTNKFGMEHRENAAIYSITTMGRDSTRQSHIVVSPKQLLQDTASRATLARNYSINGGGGFENHRASIITGNRESLWFVPEEADENLPNALYVNQTNTPVFFKQTNATPEALTPEQRAQIQQQQDQVALQSPSVPPGIATHRYPSALGGGDEMQAEYEAEYSRISNISAASGDSIDVKGIQRNASKVQDMKNKKKNGTTGAENSKNNHTNHTVTNTTAGGATTAVSSEINIIWVAVKFLLPFITTPARILIFIIATICLIIDACSGPIYALIMRYVLECMFLPPPLYPVMIERCRNAALMFLGLGVGCFIFGGLRHALFGILSELMAHDIRDVLFKIISLQDMVYFEEHSSAVLSTILTTDVSFTKLIITQAFTDVVAVITTFIAAITLSFIVGPYHLALVMLGLVPILAICSYTQTYFLNKKSGEKTTDMDKPIETISEAFTNIRVVQTYSLEHKLFTDFEASCTNCATSATAKANVAGFWTGVAYLINFGAYAAVFYFGAWLIEQGKMANPMNFILTFTCLQLSANQISEKIGQISQYASYLHHTRDLSEVLHTLPKTSVNVHNNKYDRLEEEEMEGLLSKLEKEDEERVAEAEKNLESLLSKTSQQRQTNPGQNNDIEMQSPSPSSNQLTAHNQQQLSLALKEKTKREIYTNLQQQFQKVQLITTTLQDKLYRKVVERQQEQLLAKISPQPTITFQNVCFKYPSGNKFILNNFTATFGQVHNNSTALVSPSGQGKSSILLALLKFYPLVQRPVMLQALVHKNHGPQNGFAIPPSNHKQTNNNNNNNQGNFHKHAFTPTVEMTADSSVGANPAYSVSALQNDTESAPGFHHHTGGELEKNNSFSNNRHTANRDMHVDIHSNNDDMYGNHNTSQLLNGGVLPPLAETPRSPTRNGITMFGGQSSQGREHSVTPRASQHQLRTTGTSVVNGSGNHHQIQLDHNYDLSVLSGGNNNNNNNNPHSSSTIINSPSKRSNDLISSGSRDDLGLLGGQGSNLLNSQSRSKILLEPFNSYSIGSSPSHNARPHFKDIHANFQMMLQHDENNKNNNGSDRGDNNLQIYVADSDTDSESDRLSAMHATAGGFFNQPSAEQIHKTSNSNNNINNTNTPNNDMSADTLLQSILNPATNTTQQDFAAAAGGGAVGSSGEPHARFDAMGGSNTPHGAKNGTPEQRQQHFQYQQNTHLYPNQDQFLTIRSGQQPRPINFALGPNSPVVDHGNNSVHQLPPTMLGRVNSAAYSVRSGMSTQSIFLRPLHKPSFETLTVSDTSLQRYGQSAEAQYNGVMQGDIFIDGISTRYLTSASLLGMIGYVTQFPVIFDGTLLDNLLVGRDINEVTMERVKEVCTLCCLDEVLEKLPHGLDSVISTGLSGGQAARVSLCRVMLNHNVKIVLLDEIHAALDAETAKQINLTLKQYLRGKTVISIMHRLDLIPELCDWVICLNSGVVSQQGTHDNLMQEPGLYHDLVSTLQ